MPLQDSDNFIIGRGTESYKITYQDLKDDLNYVPPPSGTIDTPTVLEPSEGAGGGGTRYLKSDAITAVEGGGISTCETDLIQSVDSVNWTSTIEAQNTNANGGLAETTGLFDDDAINTGPGYLKLNEPTGTFIEVVFKDNEGPSIASSGEIGFVSNYESGIGHEGFVEFMGGSQSSLTFDGNAASTATLPFTGSGVIKRIRITRTDTPYGGGGTHKTCITQVWADGVHLLDDASTILTFPSSNGFDCFEPGDVVGSNEYDKGWQIVQNVSEIVNPAYAFSGTTATTNFAITANQDCRVKWVVGDNRYQGKTVKVTVRARYGSSGGGNCTAQIGSETLPVQKGTIGNIVFNNVSNFSEIIFRGWDLTSNQGCLIESIAVDDVLLINDVKVVSKDPDAVPLPTITVDGGTWTTSDKLSKDTPYETKLTLSGSNDLDDMSGEVFGTTDGGAGPYTQTPYKLVTTDIESVSYVDTSTYEYKAHSQTAALNTLTWDTADLGPESVVSGEQPTTSWGTAYWAFIKFDGPAKINWGIPASGTTKTVSYFYSNDGLNWTFDSSYNQSAGNFAGPFVDSKNSALYWAMSYDSGTNNPLNLNSVPTGGLTPDNWYQYTIPDADTILTFPGAVSTNPDLQYFKAGDEVQSGVSVISTGYPASNTMVVDGGAWGPPVSEPGTNQATKWSTSLTSDNLWKYSGLEFGFDNDLATGANASTGINATERTLSGFEEYFPNGSGPYTVEVWMTDPISAGVNGGTQVSPNGDDWVTLGSGLNEVATIKFTAAQPVAFHAIRINGLVLKDGIETAKRVEYQTNGGQGTIVSTNTADNTLLISNTGDRDNRWIKDFSVAGPSIIDEPLLTNQVDLRGSDFATTPPGVDTLKEIIWSINGVEYSAGVTNPWKPLNNLPTNSTVTVKVKYKGNVLEDSEWSPDVTFTTGASLRSLFTRIAALEANDVTDDATDTALITLIAGLAARIQALEESN